MSHLNAEWFEATEEVVRANAYERLVRCGIHCSKCTSDCTLTLYDPGCDCTPLFDDFKRSYGDRLNFTLAFDQPFLDTPIRGAKQLRKLSRSYVEMDFVPQSRDPRIWDRKRYAGHALNKGHEEYPGIMKSQMAIQMLEFSNAEWGDSMRKMCMRRATYFRAGVRSHIGTLEL